jgi:hypothetical protein
MPGISSVALLNARGHVVLYRAYRDDAERASLELFRSRLRARGGAGEKQLPPVCLIESTTFASVRR